MIRLAIIYILALTPLLQTYAQDIKGDLPNSNIFKVKNGFVVYGKTKNNLKVILYNKQLELISEIDQPINKTSKYFTKVQEINNEYIFELKTCRLIVSNKGEKISFIEWTKEEQKNERIALGKENMEKYLPYYILNDEKGRESGIHVKDSYIEIISKSEFNGPDQIHIKTIPNKKYLYDGSPKLRGFISNENGLFFTYALDWQFDLEFDEVANHKWYNLGDDNLYLYLAGSKNEIYNDYIYKIDPKSGTVVFKHQLKLSGDTISVFSNLILDKGNNLIIVGNYSKIRTDEKKLSRGMQGWYAIKLNSSGEKILENRFSFDTHTLKNSKGEDFLPKKMRTRCLTFRSLSIQNNGNILLVGENIRIDFHTTNLTATSKNGDVTQRRLAAPNSNGGKNSWQTYGYSCFELDNNLKLVSKDYFKELFIDKFHSYGYKNPFVNNYNGYFSYRTQNIFELIHEDEARMNHSSTFLYPYAIVDSYLKEDSKFIVFRQSEGGSIGYFKFYRLMISGKDKGKKFLLNPSKDIASPYASYFIDSKSEIIEFFPTSKGYTLKKLNF